MDVANMQQPHEDKKTWSKIFEEYSDIFLNSSTKDVRFLKKEMESKLAHQKDEHNNVASEGITTQGNII